jgi:hypothetical protein
LLNFAWSVVFCVTLITTCARVNVAAFKALMNAA